MITDVTNDQNPSEPVLTPQQQCRSCVDSLCAKYELNAANIFTFLGHFTNFTYNLMIDVVTSEKMLLLKPKEILDPRQLKDEYFFCLLSGKAILRRITVQADGKETQFSKYSITEGSSLIGLYNYKTHNPNQFYTLQCERNCKMLQLTIPQPLTQKAYKRNTNKLSFISQFFVGKQGSYRTLPGTVLDLFKQKQYTRSTQLFKENNKIERIILVKEGLCQYLKNVKLKDHPIKMVGLFSRGENSMLGVEHMNDGSIEQFKELPKENAIFSIIVESSFLGVYQINIEDLAKIPQSFLNRFIYKSVCEFECMQKASEKILKKQNEFFEKQCLRSLEAKQTIHSTITLNESPTIRKAEFDEKINSMMGNKVKEDRQSNLHKKIAVNLNELTRAQTSAERVRDFKNLLNTKVFEKELLFKEGFQTIQEQFSSNFLTIFEPDKDIQKHLMAKTQIMNYTSLLQQKNIALMKQKRDKDSTPLFLLEDSSRVDSKSFKLKMLRRGFMKDHYEAYLKDMGVEQAQLQTSPQQFIPIQQKVQRIKKNMTKKIDITNRIKEQCMIIRSDFDSQEAVLQVLKGYQSMKQLQFRTTVHNRSRKSSVSSQNNEDGTDYGLLLNIIRSGQKKQESLQSVHQRVRFLKKRTLTPYSHEKHLRETARLQRYSVSSLRHRRSVGNDRQTNV